MYSCQIKNIFLLWIFIPHQPNVIFECALRYIFHKLLTGSFTKTERLSDFSELFKSHQKSKEKKSPFPNILHLLHLLPCCCCFILITFFLVVFKLYLKLLYQLKSRLSVIKQFPVLKVFKLLGVLIAHKWVLTGVVFLPIPMDTQMIKLHCYTLLAFRMQITLELFYLLFQCSIFFLITFKFISSLCLNIMRHFIFKRA